MIKLKCAGRRKRGAMGYINNWLHDHNFYLEDSNPSKSAMKSAWEIFLFAILLAIVIITVIAFVAPNKASIILGYFF
jgi:type IV secretory pathway component VirB8